MEIETVDVKLSQMDAKEQLLRLLIAAVGAAGGELRIPETSLELQNGGEGLVRSWDATKREIVLLTRPHGMTVYLLPNQQTAAPPETTARIQPPSRLARGLSEDEIAAALAESERIRSEQNEKPDRRRRSFAP